MSRALLCRKLYQMSIDLDPTLAPSLTAQSLADAKVSVVTDDDNGIRHMVWPSQVCKDAIEQIEKDRILAIKYKHLMHGLKVHGLDLLYRHIMHESIEDSLDWMNKP